MKDEKYHFMKANGKKFQLYNDVFEHNIAIEFVENPKNRDVEQGQFFYKDILIIPSDFWFKVDQESNEWCCTVGHGDEEQIIMELNEYIEMEIESVNLIFGEMICKDAVVLIDSEDIDDMELAKANPKMLVYHGDRVQVQKEFCK